MLRRGKSHAPDSEASSLGPSDSASQQTRIDDQVINDLMEMVEPQPIHPRNVKKAVLWDLDDCYKLMGEVVTEANKRRPKMSLAIRDSDGNPVSINEFNNIRRAALKIARELVQKISLDPRAVVFAGNPRTKVTLKKYFEAEYNEAILKLEAQKKILCLCGEYWKADQMIGQALLRRGDADTKVTPTDPFLAPPSSLSNTSCLPAELYATLIPQGSDVAPMNMAKRALELSPGPKSPSAVHTQKRSKDSLMVPGKKPIGPSMCLDCGYSTRYEV